MTKWSSDNSQHKAEIIEKRANPSDPSTFEFYIHFIGFDRRLDTWVPASLFSLETLETSASLQEQQQLLDAKNSTTRNKRRSDDTSEAAVAQLEKEHEELTKVKNISKIQMGPWEVDTWYYSPYPDEYTNIDKLYICEFCLKYMKKPKTRSVHRDTCSCRAPPGKEIYREENLSVFEIDGTDEPVYCQNLCLLAKLFLDHKTLYYDVDPFFFYVVCEVDSTGSHIVGYFSKEKHSAEGYNLACILTFPQYQRSGYGKFIISLSYEISKRTGKPGSPEKPLSDLGKLSYRSYWTYVLFHLFASVTTEISIEDISLQTAIRTEDIISTLQHLEMVREWKGQHVIVMEKKKVKEWLKKHGNRPLRLCKQEFLNWQPPTEAK
jgi:histone acetyltransferase MYST1